MSRVSRSFVLIVTFVGFLHAAGKQKKDSLDDVFDAQCAALRVPYLDLSNAEVARRLYEKAYILNFDQKWQEAEVASQCAASLFLGQRRWLIEAKDLIN